MTHLLFAGHNHYPKGGIKDLKARGTMDELKTYFYENAKAIANGDYIDNWAQIVKASTLECELWGQMDCFVDDDPRSPHPAEWTDKDCE